MWTDPEWCSPVGAPSCVSWVNTGKPFILPVLLKYHLYNKRNAVQLQDCYEIKLDIITALGMMRQVLNSADNTAFLFTCITQRESLKEPPKRGQDVLVWKTRNHKSIKILKYHLLILCKFKQDAVTLRKSCHRSNTRAGQTLKAGRGSWRKGSYLICSYLSP